MAVFTKQISLSKNNAHLQDIFNTDYYLELGNIDPNKLQKLLKKKLVKFNQLSFFNIQNKGLGSSSITDSSLKEKMPYYYFDALVDKKASNQLFITYGIFVQRLGYKEHFTPIILIPVNIYQTKEDIFFQMVSTPILNPYIPSVKHVTTNQLEKLTDIYRLDEFCMSTFKAQKSSLRLECYVTIAETSFPNLMFTSDMFRLGGPNLTNVESCFNVSKDEICQVSSLNQAQRYALEQANFGNSFAISGPLGTGKTTCLENIATNAIYHNKKVLYISNARETINDVYNFFYDKGLEYLVKDLTNPINQRSERKLSIPKNQKLMIDEITKGELDVKYQGIKDYTKILYEKVNNFYFIDIMEGLIKYKDVYQNYDEEILKGIDNVYRLEALEIQSALHSIDENIQKLDSFKDSKYNNIPIKNKETKQEIIDFIKKLRDSFKILSKEKEILENDYHFAPIANYAYFRNIINNYHQTDLNKIPTSWLEYDSKDAHKKRLPNFEKAKENFTLLEAQKASSDDALSLLSQEYNEQALNDLDIHYAINKILEKFKNKTNDEINAFLKLNKKLADDLTKIKKAIEDCEYNFGKLRDKLTIKLNYRDTTTIESIVPFISLVCSKKVPKIWFDEKNKEGIRNKLVATFNDLTEYNTLSKLYNTYFTGVENIDNNILMLKKKSVKNDKYKGVDINNLIAKIERFSILQKSINDLNQQFFDLTNNLFRTDYDVIKEYDEFIELIDNIKDEKLRSKLVKNIFTLKDAAFDEFIKPFYIFSESYLKIKENYRVLCTIGLVNKVKTELPDITEQINEIADYSIEVLGIQEKMQSAMKRQLSYVPYQEYLILQSRFESVMINRAKIDRNEAFAMLFGEMFKGHASDTNMISECKEHFEQYISIFKDNDGIKESITSDKRKEINDVLNYCYTVCDNVNELIKDYSKVFRDSISKFFYDDMDTNIEFLDSLLGSDDELSIYLTVTDGMKVLLKYKLYEFTRYIVNHDHEKYEEKFMIAYYKHLYNKFVSTHHSLMNSEGYYKLLTDISQWEKDLCNNNVEKLKLNKNIKYTGPQLKGINYAKYLNRAIDYKYLFLADSQIANLFLDVSMFDLVLVDDANLLSYDHYANLLNVPQVIFSGVNDIRVAISNDVFSKIKKNSIIEFKYRFTSTPRNLINYTRTNGTFHSDEKANIGYRITNDSCFDEIINLACIKEKDSISINKNVKINCYIGSIGKIRKLYDDIGEYLSSNGIVEEDIFSFLINQVSISDLRLGYDLESDYNIVDISDYYNEKDIYEKNNFFAHLSCVKNELIFVDTNKIIEDTENFDSEDYPVLGEIRLLKKTKDVIIPLTDVVSTKIALEIEKTKDVKVLGRYHNFDILYKQNNMIYGVIILIAPSKYDNDILNVYREYTFNEIPCTIVFLNDLIIDFNKVCKEILKNSSK